LGVVLPLEAAEAYSATIPCSQSNVPQCNVCPWKRTGDAAFVEGVEDRDPQIRACATAFVKVDKGIELELETVRPELFELDRRRKKA